MIKYILGIVLLSLLSASCGDTTGGGDGGEDTLPKIALNDVTKFEGDDGLTAFTFPVRLSDVSDKEVTFKVKTNDGTAGEEIDYISLDETITIPSGEQDAEITVSVVTDTLKELEETFILRLSDPINATLSKESVTGTIRNDDTFLAVPEGGYSTPTSYPGFDLFWSDEFDSSIIDLADWGYDLGNNGWGNNELQNYTNQSKNSYISDGNLVIEARKESDGSYTSARMLTLDKVEFTFGRIDVRAKLPYGQGIWPAIWMLGANFTEIGWPACGELDIMELVGHEPNKVHGTAHWGPQGNSTSISATSSVVDDEGYQDDYHVFSLIWEANKVEWYVDDVKTHSITPSTTSGQTYPFNEPFFMIMNVAVGGNWPGNPNNTTVFPQRMIVDYVRVFQKQ